MTKSIDYGTLMHRAMRGLIHDVLDQVERSGLPGEHHFFITFDARQPGVELADWLRERYPEEMTVVVQHWYEDLEVDDAGFVVTDPMRQTTVDGLWAVGDVRTPMHQMSVAIADGTMAGGAAVGRLIEERVPPHQV